MTGIVTKSTGSWYLIKSDEGKTYPARIRGKFRLENIGHTNPLAVGDYVDFELDADQYAVIYKIHNRKNYIIRKSVNLSKKTHIIAANIDLGFLIVTINNPRTSLGFIDRYLVTAEAYHIPTKLVFNKVDTYTDSDLVQLQTYKSIYQPLGYSPIEVSAVTGLNINLLKNEMKGITSLVSGHSGVGKSTLLNSIQTNLERKTSELSSFNQKGQHTTTFAEMFEWDFGGHCIDTPGIKEFGLVDMEKEEIQNYFPEIEKLKGKCKYSNCLHINEPGCVIKSAVERGEISKTRYQNYLIFLDESETTKI